MLKKLLTLWNPTQYSALVYEDLHRLIQNIVLDYASLFFTIYLSKNKTNRVIYLCTPREVVDKYKTF